MIGYAEKWGQIILHHLPIQKWYGQSVKGPMITFRERMLQFTSEQFISQWSTIINSVQENHWKNYVDHTDNVISQYSFLEDPKD